MSVEATQFLVDYFGASTECPVYVCTLPNADAKEREVGERHVATREPAHIDSFVQKWDRRDRALYFCTATVKPGASRRAKDTLAELNGLFVDIDLKSVDAARADVERALQQLQLLPSKVVHSGNGLHAYWLFKEGLPATPENIAAVEALLRLLADHVGGDPACCEAARLMRLPGTHNSKAGAWTEVSVVAERPLRYELDDLEDWLTVVSPVIRRRQPEDTVNGAAFNPWLAVAGRFGNSQPIDVEQRLAGMRYQGAGDSAIHATQLQVTAALLGRGTPIEVTVAVMLEATRAAAGAYGERWNWRREETTIRKMCESWLGKHPEIIERAADAPAGNGMDATATQDTASNDGKPGEQAGTAAPGNPAGSARPLLWPHQLTDFSTIPPREWLHAGHYIRRHVVMTSAPGGYGKTSLILCNVVEMATGRGVLGPAPAEALRVGYWNGEDPDEEIDRRIAGICLHYKIDPLLLQDQLYRGSMLDAGHRIARLDKAGNVVFDAKMLAEIERLIVAERIDCVVFDPLIAFHSVPEGDNVMMEQVIKGGFGQLAVRTNCCIELAQHTRKSQGQQGELTADDSRGAGALVYATRSVRVLNRMTADEAEMPKIAAEERRNYLRITRDKANMVPPGKATWIRLVSVELPNATASRPGDQVQAAESWDYPQPFDNVTAQDMHWMRDIVRQGDYRRDPRSPDWVGRPLAVRLKLDPDDRGDRKRIAAILKARFEKGVLGVATRKDKTRHEREFVVPGTWDDVTATASVNETTDAE